LELLVYGNEWVGNESVQDVLELECTEELDEWVDELVVVFGGGGDTGVEDVFFDEVETDELLELLLEVLKVV
jgi:hypothetical protein